MNEVNRGNWHFVFLNACDTAANQNWANKFSIYPGSSRRAFLGWSNKVLYEAAFDFANAFWPRINGKNAIRQAAVDAANEVPGQGTTPIRFFGDQSYNGLAWKTK